MSDQVSNRCRYRWLGGFALLFCSTLLLAHSGATGVVKKRMELMESMGKEMKSIAAMIKGERPYDAGLIRQNSAQIATRSSEVERLFPPGSLMSPSEALPVIWKQWPEFGELMRRLQQEAEVLHSKAEDAGKREVMRQFAVLGKVCSDCHTDFRRNKE